MRERTNGYTVTPEQYLRVAYVALGALTLIVLTGAAVRLTGSGLGCPTWPKCYGEVYPPLNTHAVIEFSNRLITFPVSIAAGLAWLAALRRRPYRRDLVWLGAMLPLGVVGQAVLGGFTVKGALDYGWVMGHFALSMLILARRGDPRLAGGVRARAGHGCGGGRPRRSRDRARDPRAGGARCADDLRGHRRHGRGPARGRLARTEDQPPGLRRAGDDGLRDPSPRRDRLRVQPGCRGSVVAGARRRAVGEEVQRPLTILCILLALQGFVGLDQYETHLPTELVWVHVGLACLTWLSVLWAACAAGSLVPRGAHRKAERALESPLRTASPIKFPGN